MSYPYRTVSKATSDRHKKRADDLELVVRQLAEDHDATQAELIRQRDAARADADRWRTAEAEMTAKLDGLDSEARLLADLEAAVAAYGARQSANRRPHGGFPDSIYHDAPARPYRPAVHQPLGRALLHLAQRHGILLEATEVDVPEPTCHACGRVQ